MENFQFSQCKRVLIIGAGHGIGLALVKEIYARHPACEIIATYRQTQKAQELLAMEGVNALQLTPTDEESLTQFGNKLKGLVIDAIIISVGVLECGEQTPEKSIRHFNLENMQQYFLINTFITPLAAKYLKQNLPTKSPSLFASLSAKVGSLEDNQLGGWSSYRASKAALNMYLKNIAIEFNHGKLPCRVLAIHPGTVHTELSQPFLKTIQHKIWSPLEAAQNLLQVMEQDREYGKAYFVDYQGIEIPW